MTDRDEVMAKAVGRAMAKSAALLRVAADAGDSEARFALGLLTLTGRGVERHPGEAYSLLNLAARDGDAQAAALRDVAAEQLAQAEADRRLLTDAAAHVMKNAVRQRRFPKPRLVEPD